MCDEGPVMIIYPDNLWYGNVNSEEIIDEILDAIENDVIAYEYAL